MCGKHLASLPKRLRRSVLDAYAGTPAEVLTWIKRANAEATAAAERDTEWRRRQTPLF